ncbi:MAG: hypothetical protein JO141_20210 [Bradyrhizobium sp.]|nr:hypothetical protein [Bradyrhizobium sp.]
MRTILVIVPIALLLAPQAAAQQSPQLKFDQPANAKTLPVKPPKADNSCAAYGAGFVRLADTGTCVKIGGSISVGAGTRVGHY